MTFHENHEQARKELGLLSEDQTLKREPTAEEVEALAAKLWVEREQMYPAFVRMAWDRGTPQARERMLMMAEAILLGQDFCL
jgi:hypothetical protein